MPIKTVSLETAKLLKEAGFRQDTLFSFVKAKYDAEFHLSMFKNQKDFEENKIVYDGIGISSYLEVEIEESIETYSAPTTDELLEELPKKVKGQPILIGFDETIWWVTYQKSDRILQESMDLCEALAKCWLYLKKEGLLNAKR